MLSNLLNIMTIFAALFIGYSLSIQNKKHIRWVNRLTNSFIYLILFLMGVSLSSLENIGLHLRFIISHTIVYFLVIAFFNFILIWPLDKYLPIKTHIQENQISKVKMVLESIRLIGIVILGVLAGLMVTISHEYLEHTSQFALYLLLFFIGMGLRQSGLTLRQILLNKQGIFIASLSILASFLAGISISFSSNIPIFNSLAIASGFGWYSLSGILIGNQLGPVWGSISFLLELFRELAALFIIPILIHKYPNVTLGYAGATAMDFTLPVIQKSGGIHCVPIAIISGFVLSLLMPLLMLFWLSFIH